VDATRNFGQIQDQINLKRSKKRRAGCSSFSKPPAWQKANLTFGAFMSGAEKVKTEEVEGKILRYLN
jgi:hypothetical protein